MAWSWLQRAGDIASGISEAWEVLGLATPGGFAKDVATAPFTREEEQSFLGALLDSVQDRFGTAMGAAFGPDRGVGAAVGGLPEGPLRSQRLGGAVQGAIGAGTFGAVVGGPLGAVGGAVGGGVYGAARGFEGLNADVEAAYQYGFSRPISTAATAGLPTLMPGMTGNLLQGAPEGDVSNVFRASAWRESWQLSKDRSWGQAIAVAALTGDTTNDAEATRAIGTDWGRAISGTVDAIGRLAADPSVVSGRIAAGVRTAHYIRPITTAQARQAAAFDAKVETFLHDIDGMSASQIRQRYFNKEAHGGVVAAALADAPNLPPSRRLADDAVEATGDEALESRRLVFRALVGDGDALADLYTQRADLAGRIDRLVGEQAVATRLTRAGFELPQAMKDDLKVRTDAELEALYGDAATLDRVLAGHHKINNLRFASWQAKPGQMLRDDLPRSTFFQASPAAAPLRVAAHLGSMRPQPLVNFHDAGGDVTMTRMFRQSGLDARRADDLHSRFLEARNPTERQAVWDESVDAVTEHYARKAGMSEKQLKEFLAESQRRRGKQVQEVDSSRAYDGKGRGIVEIIDEDGGTIRKPLPMWLTQERNFGIVPNLDLMEQAATELGKFRARYPKTDIPAESMELFYKVWKPSVLFRVGWPFRVIGEEQLRIFATIGVLPHLTNLKNSGKEFAATAIDHVRTRGVDPVTGDKIPWKEAREQTGLGFHEVRGHQVQNAFGTPQDGVNLHKALVAQTANLNKPMWGIEADLQKEAQRLARGERTMLPTDEGYGQFWAHDLNKQIGKDPVGRMILQGSSVDEIVRWLKQDPKGQDYFNRMELYRSSLKQGHTLEEVVGAQMAQVDDFTLGDRGLAEKALKGKATVRDLERVQPDRGAWQPIHGGIVQEAFGGRQFTKAVKTLAEKTYKALGGYPTTVLSRNPFFKHMYDAEIERIIDVTGRDLSYRELRDVEQHAREYALHQVRNTLFDLSEQSNLAHMLGFVSPFFMAMQEVTTRWLGITANNPAFVARMRLAWNSPEKAGLVVDENGNTVNENGQATQRLTGEPVEAGEDRYVILPVPDWYDGPGAELARNARFNKKSLNVVMQLAGGIGTGPIVQVPINELVKRRPELEESLKWALPYGATQDTLGLLLPATLKRIRTRVDEDGDEFKNSMIRAYYDEVVNYNLGKRETKPTWEEAEEKAKAFWSMRTVANAVLPAAPWFTSPYQLHIDAYRNAQDRYRMDEMALGGATPDEWFLDRFGEEFFVLTQSISESVDGVPPTVEGHLARKEHADLLHSLKTPSLGSLIIGDEGAGEFNRSVYEHQKLAPVRPGSDTRQREGISFEEAQAAPAVRMGWMKFSRFMDLIDAEMESRGVPNLQVKAARDLANMKRAYVAKLAEQHPEWYREYADPDPLAVQDKINDLRKIASQPDLAKRHDIRGLQKYLKLRDAFESELKRRQEFGGASTLRASANQDLAAMWETAVSRLVRDNLAFADLHHRWLSNDVPQLVAVEVAA